MSRKETKDPETQRWLCGQKKEEVWGKNGKGREGSGRKRPDEITQRWMYISESLFFIL